MIVVGMLEMNYMINGLVIQQICFKNEMLFNLWTNQTLSSKISKN